MSTDTDTDEPGAFRAFATPLNVDTDVAPSSRGMASDMPFLNAYARARARNFRPAKIEANKPSRKNWNSKANTQGEKRWQQIAH